MHGTESALHALHGLHRLTNLAPLSPRYFIERPRVRLLIASATALFLELACIRWGGSHVLYLSYVSNLLLITAFLGLGLGTWLGGSSGARTIALWLMSGPSWLLAFVACVAFSGFGVLIDNGEAIYFGNAVLQHPLPAWIVLPLLGLLVTLAFTALGVAVGRELETIARGHGSQAASEQSALTAYSLDVVGSLFGIALFSAVSWLGLPAQIWFSFALLGWLLLLPTRRAAVVSGAVCSLLTLGIVEWVDFDSLWSPYQRVSVQTLEVAGARATGDPTAGTPGYRLRVNSVVHQYITDVRRREPFYEFPYRAAGATLPGGPGVYLTAKPPNANWNEDPFAARHGWGGRVAIIGAGNGTDAAAALAYGAGSVDAVEIDPLIASIGRRLQPNHPFSDPRVHLHIMDGRTFLERPHARYDLIVFGLPDSLTLASPYASVRLESFLFTEEAFRSALRNLDPVRGLLVIYNYYRKPWLVDRIAGTLARAANQQPLVLLGPDRNLSAVFVAGPGLARVDRMLGHTWGYRVRRSRADVGTAVDDWPFLYLRERSIPSQISFALAALSVLALIAVWSVRRLSSKAERARGEQAPSLRKLAPFFLMGVAFLLLETSGLVRMSLLFGATWFVNALVFGSVLVMVLIANALARRLRLRSNGLLFALLLCSLAVAFVLEPAAFSAWDALPKYLVGTCVLFVPILLANLAFSRAFRDTPWPASAFGANLLGAVLGGALENVALVTGHSALLLIAAGLYTAAWIGTSATRVQA
jgi:hypothetical protein